MQIYLLRHGIAEEAAPSGKDADRKLTPEGIKRLGSVLKRAASAGVEPTLILSSPLERARQTADLAAKSLKYQKEVLLTNVLAPDGTPEQVWEEVRVHREESQLLLTGHEPLFSQLAAYLLNSPTLEVDFKKGALLRVDCEAMGTRPRGVLKWLLSPKLA